MMTMSELMSRVDWARPIDLSLPLQAGSHNPNAFYLADPEMSPFAIGTFVGKVAAGGPCNVENISFNPHGNGTHTECLGHITPERTTINQSLRTFHFKARLISLLPTSMANGDLLITKAAVVAAVGLLTGIEAVVIRTLPNLITKRIQRYSGTNPPYFEPGALAWLRDQGVKHLLTDLPSVDREEDGGLLQAHHAWWNYPAHPRHDATITELIYVPEQAADGDYLLNLMIAAFESDASPSKPVLYPFLTA
jgi:arylformamidase